MTKEDKDPAEEVTEVTAEVTTEVAPVVEDSVKVEAKEEPKKKTTKKKTTKKKTTKKKTTKKKAAAVPPPRMQNEPYRFADTGIGSYEVGHSYVINRLTHLSGQWVPAGCVYTVTTVSDRGGKASLVRVRGTGPEVIKLGVDKSFIFKI
jgi:hypothetical protein